MLKNQFIKCTSFKRFYSYEVMKHNHDLIPTKVNKMDDNLEIQFSNGDKFKYPADYLFVNDHHHSILANNQHAKICELDTIGCDKIQILFEDHNTSTFSFVYLHQLGKNLYNESSEATQQINKI
eukprot:TRINITY_DN15509_c0_g1_i1.p1 TRINITY_DN15509_c0_g1~~TRINITY_DN15509_c0_g1_i1.p1  ORF type:complete len:124 (+),score=18.25 TRINITY_DN15509_c0_g1_i1:34-405(+)